MSQTDPACKKKDIYIQWEIHRYKSTSLFQITAGYNQWCPRLHHKRHTVQVIPSTHTVQAISSMHTIQSIPSISSVQVISPKKKKGALEERMAGALEEKMAGALEEKVVDLKGRKRGEGGKTKEKDIMKRRQEGGEEEKKMGTEEKGRRRNR